MLLAGQLSLGQAGFASLAAFTRHARRARRRRWSALSRRWSSASPSACRSARSAAFMLGLPVMRLRGVFLAIATLGFGEMVRIFADQRDVDRRRPGHAAAQAGRPCRSPGSCRWPGRLLVLAAGGSRLGPAPCDAIREDELAAGAMGIDVAAHRMAAFVSAGAVAGLYGVLFAYFSRFIAPNDFGFSRRRRRPGHRRGRRRRDRSSARCSARPSSPSCPSSSARSASRPAGSGRSSPALLLLVVILFLPGGLPA